MKRWHHRLQAALRGVAVVALAAVALQASGEVTYERIRAYVEQHSPEFLPRIKLHTAQTPLMLLRHRRKQH